MGNRSGADVLGPQKSFVIEMRARREVAGISRYKLAERLGCSSQWLGKVENFEKPPSEGLADDLDTFFAAEGLFRRLWQQLTEERRKGLVSVGFRSLIEAERTATEISCYEPVLIPGLFQSVEYARLQLSSGMRPDELEELVALRMERQTIFEGPDAPWIFLLLRESALRDLPRSAMESQCKRLLDLQEHPKVCMQIIPSGAHVFLPTGFQVLRFEEGADLGYVEGSGQNSRTLTDPKTVRRLTVRFDLSRSAARPAEETGDLIRSVMEGA